MRTLTARRSRNGRTVTSTALRRSGPGVLKRAATMLEFAMILPIFMFMLLFVIDMGHLVLMSGAMQDATFSAARTGAQLGGAGIDTTGTGSVVCTNGSTCSSGATYNSLKSTAAQIPGYGRLGTLKSMTVLRGARCISPGPDTHVAIRSTYDTSLLTPGLVPMLRMFSDGQPVNAPEGKWRLSSTAVARCEIVRTVTP